MRIGIVSPYSLTLPGGVQGQILSLARVLRQKGHETRVLGPCDGPPPDAGVTPLGNSLPTAANGSIAPIAPDMPAQLRTIRALREEAFDVVHLHEPLAPGPTHTALLFRSAPTIGTFHAAGDSASYKYLRPMVRWEALHLVLPRVVVDPRISRKVHSEGGRHHHVVNLHGPEEVDDVVRGWLTEAYVAGGLAR